MMRRWGLQLPVELPKLPPPHVIDYEKERKKHIDPPQPQLPIPEEPPAKN
jgi:hypothetical protein